MLSAHQPFARFPDLIKEAARAVGGTAQVAGGVPAMCDGVTQGEKGMELSLFSRDVIALSTAVALSHDMFDAAVYLGVCDKIVPGLLIGALSFGHLPAVFLPAGPMPSGLPNDEKSKVRQLYAEGKASRAELLAAEAQAYHAPGTCTFYGTANTNQMLMEIMGLHLPGASFVNPNTPLRDALTMLGVKRALELTALGNEFTPIGHVIDERAVVNGVVGLHATGGSTNHTIHLIAMAAAAGIALTWEDFADLAEVTPLLTRIYPNGKADVNHFHAAGGMGVLIRELEGAGLLHGDARTVWGERLADYAIEPHLDDAGEVQWRPARDEVGRRRACCGALTIRSSRPGASRSRRAVGAGGHQDVRGRAGAACDRGAGAGVPQPGGAARRVPRRRARPRLRRGGALPGPEGDRHAGAAQADAAARGIAGPRP